MHTKLQLYITVDAYKTSTLYYNSCSIQTPTLFEFDQYLNLFEISNVSIRKFRKINCYNTIILFRYVTDVDIDLNFSNRWRCQNLSANWPHLLWDWIKTRINGLRY